MSKELGTLVIVVLKGQHLIDNHTFYKQDPYVKLSLSGATKPTPVDPKGGQHPVWDVELRFPISRDPSKSNRTLMISVFSEEKKEDELLGEGTVDITDTLKSGEFDGASHLLSPQVAAGSTSRIDWVPLSLKGTQRGDVYLEMTFFAAGPAPLNRRPSKFTNPAERLARPQQQPAAQRPQRLVSQPLPSGLAPGRQWAQRPNSNEGSRQGRPTAIQQVPLPGSWPGPSAQQRQSTQTSAASLPNRRSSRGEDTPLPPLPPNATPPKEEFVPSILRPGGPSRTGVGGAPSPPMANGTPGHHHTMPNDSGPNTAYPPRHHTVNQTMPPFPGSHLHRRPIITRLHRSRNRNRSRRHSNIHPISLRTRRKGLRNMLGVTHTADMQLRSLTLKHSLKSHIPNTIRSLPHRHNRSNKYNTANGSKHSLKEDHQLATARPIQPIIIRPSRTSRLLALRHPASRISLLQALNRHLSPM